MENQETDNPAVVSFSETTKQLAANSIALLADDVARKIAAGEVIDRPAAVVRELLDNSMDARASDITLVLNDGGIRSIRVIDNGHGMRADDLKLATLPHATSKIHTIEDLNQTSSLGFRGEALASIAAVSRLTITSTTHEPNSIGNRLTIDSDGAVQIAPYGATPGTTVDVRDLFYNLPARKRFLRHSSVESRICRTLFIEKSLPFPKISMRLLVGPNLRLFLPPGSFIDRIVTTYAGQGITADRLHRLTASGERFKLTIIAADPNLQLHDRKLMQIFVNRRRLSPFTLMQGIEYSYGAYIPGGLFPAVFVFIEIDPALVDFNIHPAKREARIRNLGEIRQLLSHTLDSFLHNYALRLTTATGFPIETSEKTASYLLKTNRERPKESAAEQPLIDFGSPNGDSPKRDLPPLADLTFLSNPLSAHHAARRQPRTVHDMRIARYASVTAAATPQVDLSNLSSIRYIGQIFNLFLLAQLDDRLLIVDQHAGHEKILYVRYREQQQPQELLIPISLELGAEEENNLRSQLPEWEKTGLRLTRERPGLWSIVALPQSFIGHEQLLLESITSTLGPQKSEHDFFAFMACHTAVRAGDPLDDKTAATLLTDILSLDNGHCPHGRPVWIEVSRDQLMQLVSRF